MRKKQLQAPHCGPAACPNGLRSLRLLGVRSWTAFLLQRLVHSALAHIPHRLCILALEVKTRPVKSYDFERCFYKRFNSENGKGFFFLFSYGFNLASTKTAVPCHPFAQPNEAVYVLTPTDFVWLSPVQPRKAVSCPCFR